MYHLYPSYIVLPTLIKIILKNLPDLVKRYSLILMHLILGDCLDPHHLSTLLFLCCSSSKYNRSFSQTVFLLLLPARLTPPNRSVNSLVHDPYPSAHNSNLVCPSGSSLSPTPKYLPDSEPPLSSFLKSFMYLLFLKYLLQNVTRAGRLL